MYHPAPRHMSHSIPTTLRSAQASLQQQQGEEQPEGHITLNFNVIQFISALGNLNCNSGIANKCKKIPSKIKFKLALINILLSIYWQWIKLLCIMWKSIFIVTNPWGLWPNYPFFSALPFILVSFSPLLTFYILELSCFGSLAWLSTTLFLVGKQQTHKIED